MKKLISIFAILSISALFFSCKTIKYIQEDKTAAQIIQMGQNCVSVSDYISAEFCYTTVLDRFGTDPSIFAEAKYELGHTYLRQRKYDKAYTTFNELLDIYDAYGTALPGAYKKLCNIGLSQIPEKRLKELEAKNSERQ